MKLKKKHFKRLKDIAVSVNEIVPGTGVRLDKLIAEIESVQKVPIPESSFLDSIQSKIGESKEYKSIDEYIEKYFKYRDGKVREAMTRNTEPKEWFTNPNNGILEVKKGSEIEKFLDDALVLSNKDPKIGDVGYFFGSGDAILPVLYGILQGIDTNNKYPYTTTTGQYRSNFSKTPPELK